MRKFKSSLIALSVLATLSIATLLMPHPGFSSNASGGSAPTSQTQNVNVVNVPTVSSQQSGTWNVGINGTPVVGLDAANNTVKFDAVNNTVKIDSNMPVLVRDVDNPARQPYQIGKSISLTDGQAATTFFLDIPAGKVFVVEYVAVNGCVPVGQTLQIAEIGITGPGQSNGVDGPFTQFYAIDVGPRGTSPFACGDQFAGGQTVRLFAQPGVGTVRLFVQRNSTAGSTGFIIFGLSGYLVNLS
jgi:hypothetical protein